MNNTKVTLAPLEAEDREQFILDNQESFKYGAVEEFGLRDDHFEEDGEIISRATIEQSIDAPDSEAYRILYEGRKVGGVVLKIDKETHHNELEFLFVSPKEHSKRHRLWRLACRGSSAPRNQGLGNLHAIF